MLKIDTKDGEFGRMQISGQLDEIMSDVAIVVYRVYHALQESDKSAAAAFRACFTEMTDNGVLWGSHGDLDGVDTVDDLLRACGGEAEP